MHLTTRLALQVPDGTDPVTNFPGVDSQAMGILDNAGIYQEGTLAARPVSPSPSSGAFYRATDTGQIFESSGGSWFEIERLANKGTASGYCDLDSGAHVPLSRLAAITASQLASGASATNVGSVGGDLTGTLPNPTLSTQGLNKFPQLLTAQKIQFAFGGSTIVAVSGWNTYTITYSNGTLGTPLVGFYACNPAIGASISASHIGTLNASNMLVAVNSNQAQNITIYVLALGN